MRTVRLILMASLVTLLAGCSNTGEEQKPVPLTDEEFFELVEAALVDSFAISVSVENGEYVITGQWEIDPLADPDTEYVLVIGSEEHGIKHVQKFSGAEAEISPQTADQSPMKGNINIPIGMFREPLSSTDEGGDNSAYENFPFEEESFAVLFEAILREPVAPEKDPLIVDQIDRARLVLESLGRMKSGEEMMDAINRGYEFLQNFRPGQLVPDNADAIYSLIRTKDTQRMIVPIRAPRFDREALIFQLESVIHSVNYVEEQTFYVETTEMTISKMHRNLAIISDPLGTDALAVCAAAGGISDYGSGDGEISHCEADYQAMIMPARHADDWVAGADASLQLQLFEGMGVFDNILISILPQRTADFVLTPSNDLKIEAGEMLKLFPREDGQEYFPFSLNYSGHLRDNRFVAFRVQAFNSRGVVVYEDVIELDLTHKVFTSRPE